MTKFSSTDEYYELWMLLSSTRDSIWKARQKELDRYNISVRQAGVLFTIQALGDKATPAELSRWILREPQSISEVLNRMAKEGLVQKVKDLKRKNMYRIVLTEKGREAYHQSSKRKSIHAIMSSLTTKELQQVRSSLQKLRDKALRERVEMGEIPIPYPHLV